MMRMVGRFDAVDLEILPKHPHHIHHGEDNVEAILYYPLHIPADEQYHLWRSFQQMRPVGNGVIQGLP